jgi:uncharacterized damage-inducible protein DinB
VFTLDGVRKFHSWTHACIDVVLDHLATIPPDAYAKPVPNFGFPSLREQVIHIFNCEGFWIHTLQGQRFIDRTPAECPTLAEARRLQHDVHRETLAYLSAMTDQKLNANTELHFPDGDVAVRTPALIVHHVLTHAFHHKGQLVAMCRALGYPAQDTDLNRFE